MTTETSNISMIDLLPQDVQDTIYRYKHQMEFREVIDQLNRRSNINKCIFCSVPVDAHYSEKHSICKHKCVACGYTHYYDCNNYLDIFSYFGEGEDTDDEEED